MNLKQHWIRMVFLSVALCLSGSAAQAQSATKAARASVPPSLTSPDIQFAGRRLTVNVTDVYLREVFKEIARQAGFTLIRHSSLDDQITIKLHELPLDTALRRILRHRSFVLNYADYSGNESESAVSPLVGLWVLVP